jgi:hypothetical protein
MLQDEKQTRIELINPALHDRVRTESLIRVDLTRKT